MIVTFDSEELQIMYEEGKNPNRKYRFQPDIIRRYQKAINFLKASSSIESLWKIQSLNYEVLSGDKSGRSSVHVNNRYRLEFTVDIDSNEPMLTVCNIIELSNHYK